MSDEQALTLDEAAIGYAERHEMVWSDLPEWHRNDCRKKVQRAMDILGYKFREKPEPEPQPEPQPPDSEAVRKTAALLFKESISSSLECEQNARRIGDWFAAEFAHDYNHLVAPILRLKAGLVERDERDSSRRAEIERLKREIELLKYELSTWTEQAEKPNERSASEDSEAVRKTARLLIKMYRGCDCRRSTKDLIVDVELNLLSVAAGHTPFLDHAHEVAKWFAEEQKILHELFCPNIPEIEQLKAENEQLTQQLECAKGVIKTHVEERRELLDRVDTLKRSLTDAEAEIERLKKIIENAVKDRMNNDAVITGEYDGDGTFIVRDRIPNIPDLFRELAQVKEAKRCRELEISGLNAEIERLKKESADADQLAFQRWNEIERLKQREVDLTA